MEKGGDSHIKPPDPASESDTGVGTVKSEAAVQATNQTQQQDNGMKEHLEEAAAES